ncbi:hypothetical protein CUMW_221400 [Citrus unshiu]|uniref:C2HC NPR-type domain-containing protein n=1 Tax=Citrus unshiu TaxID=55188 RepID=A0A2H5QE44_CITUN|nr:hypothetical protein CUMW_221400 [Citrus unshiu]
MTDLVPHAKVGYEAFNDTLHYLYIGWPKASPPEVSTCVDDACAHLVCPPAINYAIERMYASAAFQMTEVVSFYEESEANIAEVDPMHAKIVRGICKALHSGDVELLNLLLTGYKVTLDDAYALHYAAAYCSPNFLVEVLNMGSADLNLKDARGHTVLHVAARRKEPAVLVSLLSKGACASETTSDGQTTIAISTKQGQETNKD